MNRERELLTEIATLKRQIAEANDTLRAIRQGEVDAVVVQGAGGNQVYTLQTADHPYRILVQQMNEGAVVLSREGFILHSNPRFCGLVMALPEDLNAQSIRPWLAPEDLEQFEAGLRLAFGGRSQRLEMSLVPRHPEASPVPVVLSLAPLNLGSVDGVCGIVTDLRERRQREALRGAELLARSLMDHAAAAVVITNREGRIVRANAAAEALAGRPLMGEDFESAFPLAFDAPALASGRKPGGRDLVEIATSGGSFRGLQARMKAALGHNVELQVSAGPFNPSDNLVTGAVFTLADVTALRTSEQRFRALAESIPHIVWTLDRTGRMDYCNTVGTDYFGMTVPALADAFERLAHPEDRPRVNESWERALRSGEPLQGEYRLVNRSGEARWFLARAVPVRDTNGRITQWFGTFTDVDDQKRIENDLRRANADLEHFAYAASHDFQEPLRMVTAYTQLLQRDVAGQLNGAAAMSFRYVLEGADRMSALLQNLLVYMRASRNPEAAERIDCNEVLREVMANLQIPIEQSGATIRSDALPRLLCPRVHLLEVLQNLISNAIKYRGSAPPQIQVSAEEAGGEWIFSIGDNGIGIAPEHQQNIFEVFKRLHGNNIPGTGIGLAICRRLIEQHRGRIWVESRLNRGSVFHFSLPAAGSEQVNESAHA